MPPDARGLSAATWRRLTIAIWATVVAGVCLRGAVQPGRHSLYPTYLTAGAHWIAGTSLYRWADTEPGLEPYRYSPLVAALLAPFRLLDAATGSVLWRLANAGVLLAGMAAWLRSPLPWQPNPTQRALMYLIVLPLALGSLNNGQTNLMVIGLLLLTIAAAGGKRWNAAALCLALATALKVYPVVMGMLLAVVYPRKFALPLLAALALVAALPFMLQRPEYVAAQYADWSKVLNEDNRRFWPLHMAYRDFWLLLRITKAPISTGAYTMIQVLSGATCAVICLAGRLRGRDPARLLTAVLALGTCWMTLCGPATESSTFVLLAPALAYGILSARVENWQTPEKWLPAAAAILLLVGVLAGLTQWTAYIHSFGVQPAGALLLFAGFLIANVRELIATAAGGQEPETIPAPRAA